MRLSGSRRWLTWLGWVAFTAALVVIVAGTLRVGATTTTDGPSAVTIVVLPHPDDEFQAWSLLENTPAEYKVFVVLTRGEQTRYCSSEGYSEGYQPGLEPPASPVPDGQWTESCELARTHSLLAFLSGISQSDPSIPGDFGAESTIGPLPDDGTELCRFDDDDTCIPAQRTAQVWVDKSGRGAVVSFDLGDGDLTTDEAAWAVRALLDDRAGFGINSDLPIAGLVGSFANAEYPCYIYDHPDHMAVAVVLRDITFGAQFQTGATCAGDPKSRLQRTVSDESVAAAFEVAGEDQNALEAERLGVHVRNYGWLSGDYYHIDRSAQELLFHSHQHFWVSFYE